MKVNKKLFAVDSILRSIISCGISSAILFGGLTAFASSEEWPVKGIENVMAVKGIELIKTVEDDGSIIYGTKDIDLQGNQELWDQAMKENNDKIDAILENDPISRLGEQYKLESSLIGWWNSGTAMRVDLDLDIKASELGGYINSANLSANKSGKQAHQHDWIYYSLNTSDKVNKKYRACDDCDKWETVKEADFAKKEDIKVKAQ